MVDGFQQQRLLTLKEAAAYLGRSTYAMRSLVWSGAIRAVVNNKNGGRQKIWVDRFDLDGWIEGQKTTL
jgi:hypothetical protein